MKNKLLPNCYGKNKLLYRKYCDYFQINYLLNSPGLNFQLTGEEKWTGSRFVCVLKMYRSNYCECMKQLYEWFNLDGNGQTPPTDIIQSGN